MVACTASRRCCVARECGDCALCTQSSCRCGAVRSTIRLNKTTAVVDDLIGAPFGSVFEVQGGRFVPVEGELEVDTSQYGASCATGAGCAQRDSGRLLLQLLPRLLRVLLLAAVASCPDVDVTAGDNRNVVDDNSAQTMTSEDIGRMREQGATGHEIMQALMENSTTFAGKTEFSRAKYVRKKHKKCVGARVSVCVHVARSPACAHCRRYVTRVQVVQASVRNLAHHLFEKNPLRIMCVCACRSLTAAARRLTARCHQQYAARCAGAHLDLRQRARWTQRARGGGHGRLADRCSGRALGRCVALLPRSMLLLLHTCAHLSAAGVQGTAKWCLRMMGRVGRSWACCAT